MDVQSAVFVLRTKVAELEAKLAFLYTQLNITYVPDVDALNAPVIERVRAYRDIHQTSLTETNAAVVALKAKYKL